MTTLALDIGGANIKAAYGGVAGGRCETVSVAFALWKEPGRLTEKLAEVAGSFSGFDRVLVTMTAELCDCFETKRAGVSHVLGAVEAFAKPRAAGAVRVWTTEGRFVTVREAVAEPIKAAASNWHALATFVAGLYPDGLSLLIDTGSTTTDIIRLRDGRVDATRLTDMQRLNSGELVYLGALRTPLAALGPLIEWRGRFYGVMAELFATTADVFFLTGELSKGPLPTDTADGRPMTEEFAAARIARMIGGDLEMITIDDARELAGIFAGIAARRVSRAIAWVLKDKRKNENAKGEEPTRIVISGGGYFLAEMAANMAFPARDVVNLSDRIGMEASRAACAYALLQLDK